MGTLHDDPTARFSGRSEDYAAHRPDYPPHVLELLRTRCGLTPAAVVADVGCGTGKFARLLVDHGNYVYGVEPNADMWRVLHQELGSRSNFLAVRGRAEDSGLPPHSIDVITAAQAFHWFDAEAAAVEWRRILRPHGTVVLVWHVRRQTGTPFLEAYERFLRAHGIDYDGAGRIACDGFLGVPFLVETSSYSQSLDRNGFRGRVMSTSYIPAEGHPRHAAMRADLEALFDRFAVDGRVAIDYDTEIHHGRFAPESFDPIAEEDAP